MFLCDKDPQTLLNESVANLELLAQKIHEIENNIKKRPKEIIIVLNEQGTFKRSEARDYESD